MEKIGIRIEKLWHDIENIRLLVILCYDGFSQREIIDYDTVEGVMKSLANQLEGLSNKFSHIIEDIEKYTWGAACDPNDPDRNQ